MSILKRFFRKFMSGASWQNPLINAGFKALDPIDYAVRLTRGLGDLPRYSVRVRSNGVMKQFGGRNFQQYGVTLANYLEAHAGLRRTSRVLDIGCGCGRTAHALVDRLDDGRYTGVDIEALSIEDCQKRAIFVAKQFHFKWLDVQNDEYNPAGRCQAHEYRFPFDDGSFDVIFLVSVFSHMLTRDVEHYIAEIARLLSVGGHCMVTTFLMDDERKGNVGTFASSAESHFFVDPSMPEIAVGYEQQFFERNFAKHGLITAHGPIFGWWRRDSDKVVGAKYGQDILFFRKPADTAA